MSLGLHNQLTTYKKKRDSLPVTNGLVIHLDASRTSSYPGSGTTWTDLSGKGNHFVMVNSANITHDSTYKYFTLNGSGGSYFTGPAGNSSSLSTVNTYFTAFFVCKPSNGTQAPFSFQWSGSTTDRNFSVHIPWSNTINFDVNGCCNADQRISYSTNVSTQIATAANWAFRSRSDTTPRRQIFYNNVSQVDSGTNTTSTNWGSTSSVLNLGAYSGGSNPWQTRIWGFYLYDRGLSDSEMTQVNDYLTSNYSGLLV